MTNPSPSLQALISSIISSNPNTNQPPLTTQPQHTIPPPRPSTSSLVRIHWYGCDHRHVYPIRHEQPPHQRAAPNGVDVLRLSLHGVCPACEVDKPACEEDEGPTGAGMRDPEGKGKGMGAKRARREEGEE
ncbi:hypothetical protein MMC20_001967 [Loxospora ochrophaea]|nr:hypothetical protein [Loxospora ochrophaea]